MFRYGNVYEGGSLEGMAGHVIFDDPDDEGDANDEQIRAEEEPGPRPVRWATKRTSGGVFGVKIIFSELL